MRTWPDDVVESLGRATREVMAELAATDPLAERIGASLAKYLAECDRYAQSFDLRFLQMRAKALAI